MAKAKKKEHKPRFFPNGARLESGFVNCILFCMFFIFLRSASDYTGRLLIDEAPSNDWKKDRMPDEFADRLGTRQSYRYCCNLNTAMWTNMGCQMFGFCVFAHKLRQPR